MEILITLMFIGGGFAEIPARLQPYEFCSDKAQEYITYILENNTYSARMCVRMCVLLYLCVVHFLVLMSLVLGRPELQALREVHGCAQRSTHALLNFYSLQILAN